MEIFVMKPMVRTARKTRRPTPADAEWVAN
jgi:hypothetical protein